MMFIIPAIEPKKKNNIINQGLVSNQLSKINPIIVPTRTAETSSVPNLKAFPINEAFSALSLISELFLFLSFAIFRRILKSSKSGINFMLPILLLDLGQQPLIDSLLFQALSHHKVYAF